MLDLNETPEQVLERNFKSGRRFGKAYLRTWNYGGLIRAFNSAVIDNRFESCLGYEKSLLEWIDTYQGITIEDFLKYN